MIEVQICKKKKEKKLVFQIWIELISGYSHEFSHISPTKPIHSISICAEIQS
jgi:hypothetical protein